MHQTERAPDIEQMTNQSCKTGKRPWVAKTSLSPGNNTQSLGSDRVCGLRRPPELALWSKLRLLLAMAIVGVSLSPVGPVAASQTTCVQSGPESLAYEMHICLTNPPASVTLSGIVTVTSEATVVGPDPGTRRVVFYLDGTYILTDYQTPYTFSLDTRRYSDGPHVIEAEQVMRDAFVSSRATESVDFDNSADGATPFPATFTPSTGRPASQGEPFIVAAVGDGAGGEKNETSVTDMISTWEPNLVLYLGDVYDRGSPAEFDNWYGAQNSLFGRFRAITDPVVGNHEYQTADASGYFGFWNDVPHYYSLDAGGWHFVALDSTTEFDQTSPGSAQFTWLQQDLAANRSVCTLVFLHHPFVSVGEHGNSPQLTDIWPLLVSSGVDLVLSGHDHSYQRWQPLDANGSPDAKGTTQFVVGTGGHSVRNDVREDPNLALHVDTPSAAYGALRLSLTPSAASYDFINSKGDTLDSGSVNCTTPNARNSAAAASPASPAGATDSVNGTRSQPSEASKYSGIGVEVAHIHLIPAVLILVLLAAGVALGFVLRVTTEDSDSS